MEVTVTPYARGAKINPQDLDDEDFSLVVDKANSFAFKMDDIEKAHSHVDFISMASNRAAYRLADQFDQEALGYFAGYSQSVIQTQADTVNTTVSGTKAVASAGSDELLTSMKLRKDSFGNITTASAANHSIPIAARLPGATALPTATISPAMLLARMGRLLDSQNVSTEGRWVVLDPVFCEILADEDSRLLDRDFGETGGMRNGLYLTNLYGFKVYKSNNLPSVGTGPSTTGTANQNTNYGVILAGHSSSVAAVEQITSTESFRSQDSFADVVRGMHLYGRKILRPEALTVAKYNLA